MSRRTTNPRPRYERVKTAVARVRKRMQRLARKATTQRIERVRQLAEYYRARNDPWSATTLENLASLAEAELETADHQPPPPPAL